MVDGRKLARLWRRGAAMGDFTEADHGAPGQSIQNRLVGSFGSIHLD